MIPHSTQQRPQIPRFLERASMQVEHVGPSLKFDLCAVSFHCAESLPHGPSQRSQVWIQRCTECMDPEIIHGFCARHFLARLSYMKPCIISTKSHHQFFVRTCSTYNIKECKDSTFWCFLLILLISSAQDSSPSSSRFSCLSEDTPDSAVIPQRHRKAVDEYNEQPALPTPSCAL